MEDKELLESLIGKTKEDAETLCNENKFKMRVIREDSINYIITMDLRFDRINIRIDNGIVTSCDVG